VGARSRPASSDEITITEHQIDAPFEIGKRAAELPCN
jgi:hypothetical protein